MSDDATVLIVEDEEDLAEMYADTLSERYEVITVHSGEAALEQIDSSVDVLLLDRRMPGISGDDVLEQIDKDELQCRVVMVTAVEPDIGIVEMDFDEYLVKPVTREELIAVVEQMLARNTHDAKLEEMIEVATKLATLETKLELSQLEQSTEYQKLRNRFGELRETVDVPQDDMYLTATQEKIQALMKEYN